MDLSDPQTSAARRPDPMADTTRLPRVGPPRPGPGLNNADDYDNLDGYGNYGNFDDFDNADDDTVDTADLDNADDDTVDTADLDAAEDDTADPAGLDGPAGLDAADDGPARPWSARSLLRRHRRRLAMGAAGVVAVAALLALPPVRAQLRDSFTKLPTPYAALYFTTPPQVNGTVLTVPVGVHAADSGNSTYIVRVWTVDAQGRTDDSRSAAVKWDGQALTTVVNLPVNPTAVYVKVSLDSSTETLHYKIAVS